MNGFIHFPVYSHFLSYLSAQPNAVGVTYRLDNYSIDKTSLFLLTYDLKNRYENLTSRNRIRFDLPLLSNYSIHEQILLPEKLDTGERHQLKIQQRTSKAKYLENVQQLQHHIQRGDIYEVNYCIEFFAENAVIDPVQVFNNLSSISEAPFSFLAKI